MAIEVGPYSYEWQADWAKLPVTDGWSHHGFTINKDGNLVSGHAKEPKVLILDPEGNLLEEIEVPVTETHGLTISEENGEEILWIVDTASKYETEVKYPVQLLKCTMQGEVLARLTREDFNYDEEDSFRLTACTVDPNSGKLWVTDGYGAGRIHRFSQDLKLELTIDGSEGEAGKFACPHWVWADTRADHTRIYVADRGNHRIQVFNTDGEFIKCISDGLITPSAFGVFDDVLVVAELKARLVLLDKDDAIIGYIGEGHAYVDKPGWPNRLDGKTPISPLDDIEVGKFNSPHGMCVDPQGNIYVSEWLIGDRYTKLKRLS